MKSWGWLLLFVLTVLASVYVLKKAEPAPPAPTEAPVPVPVPVTPTLPTDRGGGVPAPRNMPNTSEPRGYAPDTAPPQPAEQNSFREPEIPPPPGVPSFPENEPPEYFDGEAVPPPFEPPPPLEEGGIPSPMVPPPAPIEPEGLD